MLAKRRATRLASIVKSFNNCRKVQGKLILIQSVHQSRTIAWITGRITLMSKFILPACLSLALAWTGLLHAQSINPSALTGAASQGMGSAVNNAVGNGLMNQGQQNMQQGQQNKNQGQVSQGIMQMLQGLMALAQALADQGAQNQSNNTANTSAATNPSLTTTPTPAPLTQAQGLAMAFQTPQGQAAVNALTNAGVSVGPDGVTMPDGTQASWSQVGGGSGGGIPMDGATQKALADALASARGGDSGASVKSVGTAAADGGGGGAGDSGSFTPGKFTFKNPFAVAKAKKDQILAGMTENMGGEPIGVKGDDIFDMIARAYNRKKQNHDFIDEASGEARLPASVPALPSGSK